MSYVTRKTVPKGGATITEAILTNLRTLELTNFGTLELTNFRTQGFAHLIGSFLAVFSFSQ